MTEPDRTDTADGTATRRPPGGTLTTRAWWIGCAALLVATLAALYSTPWLPTHDGPQHVYAAWAHNHWSELGALHERLALNPHQTTALGFDAVFGPLERLMPWRGAMMLALAVIVATSIGGAFVAAALATPAPGRRSVAWLAVPLSMPWMLYMGYLNYVAGLALAGWAVAGTLLALRWHSARRHGAFAAVIGALAVLMWAQSVAHVFAACLTGVLVFAMVSAEAVSRRAPGLFAAFAVPALPVLAVAWSALDGGGVASAAPPTYSAAVRFELASTTLTGGLVPLSPVLLAGAVGAAMWAVWRPARPWARGLALASLVLLGLHLLAPFDIPGWYVFAPRFGIPGVLAGLLAAVGSRGPDLSVSGRVLALSAAFLALLWAGSTALMHRAVYADCAAALAPLELPPHETLAFVPVGVCGGSDVHPMPLVHWLRNADAVHAMDHGSQPDLFRDAPAIHTLMSGSMPSPPLLSDWAAMDAGRLQDIGDPFGPPAAQPRAWLDITSYLAGAMARRDLSIVYGRAAAELGLFERGFAVREVRSGVYVARFEGCRARLAATDAPDQLRARARFYPDDAWFDAGAQRASDGSFGLVVPCGAAAIEVWDDRDDNGAPDPGEPHCVDSSGAAELLRIVPPGQPVTIDCEVTRDGT